MVYIIMEYQLVFQNLKSKPSLLFYVYFYVMLASPINTSHVTLCELKKCMNHTHAYSHHLFNFHNSTFTYSKNSAYWVSPAFLFPLSIYNEWSCFKNSSSLEWNNCKDTGFRGKITFRNIIYNATREIILCRNF